MHVLYDGECGFCAWALGLLLRWDRDGRLRPVAIQSEEGQQRLGAIAPELRLASWHAVDQDGVLRSGSAALPHLLQCLPGGRSLARVTARYPRVAERTYGWIAAHRSALGSAVPRASKRRARELIADRMH
jgi:predicted DCC family thiol-disulfide oxidoreductase YuxK